MYFDFNTNKRKNPVNSFQKNLKLMNNSIYGKIMENLTKRVKVRLVNMLRIIKNALVSQLSFKEDI